MLKPVTLQPSPVAGFRQFDNRTTFPYLLSGAQILNPQITALIGERFIADGDALIWGSRTEDASDGWGMGIVRTPSAQSGEQWIDVPDDVAQIEILTTGVPTGLSSVDAQTGAVVSETVTTVDLDVTPAETLTANVVNPSPTHVATVERSIQGSFSYDIPPGASVKIQPVVNGVVQTHMVFMKTNNQASGNLADSISFEYTFVDPDERLAPNASAAFVASWQITLLAGATATMGVLADWKARAKTVPIDEFFSGSTPGLVHHFQSSAQSTWTVAHTMTNRPIVLLVNPLKKLFWANVEYTSATEVTINHAVATTGQALLWEADEVHPFGSLATWTINHALTGYPHVALVDSAGTVIQADIEYTSTTQIVVTHDAAIDGEALLVADTGIDQAEATAKANWDVVHNLATYPLVTTRDANDLVIYPEVTYPTVNQVSIQHADPQAGSTAI